ncbi:MAG: WecB/TagA/CpsF family glycosyltransferase [Moorea sp. SIO3E2]|uniref:Bacterial polymer biosynthesis protein, WecB/TagA/CpsF family n=1 Tax=Moorena producens 3L TaxID=489825 RepID=F4XKN8_9CYAN|nr:MULTISPECIES: WecB/TagA/CpsF family glycosyltransferase [Moorena]NEP32002.1 WecB/TagA/CpsF family glycosyltransferase [Moorena sp. SIO3B2]NEP68472.1 WecB/TagA/CpsF family glycosyltransferase [Moorena sp. SIO3A5]NEQ13796.1 WecB/TagA/CpsF family glycosyltransferase [Moorena sp. SIO3E2]NER90484.1 WecB/TagA/CpsF family glycosyltransferase [Moorena sp. SIO3A2]NES42695.1 WecB/TagA/CpsF family glycosyltransferase [Moorena sp. SIO2C4]
MREIVKILNLEIDNISKSELLKRLDTGVIFTPNVDHLVKLQKDPEFMKAYRIADYRLCDSKVVYYASRFLGSPIQEKISGSDLFPAFYDYHRNNKTIKIFLLGGREGVAKQAQENVNARVGREIVIAAHSPSFGFEKNDAECREIIEMVKNSGATVLAVGVGAPKQEKWIHKYKDQLPNIKIFMAVGATLDFEAGTKPRSPEWMSDVGLEWLHRLLSEPRRLWRRYLFDAPVFLWLVLKQKLKSSMLPPARVNLN